MFIEAKHYSPKHEHSIVESKFSNKQKPKLIPNFESFQELNFEKTFVGANQERVVSSFLFANDSAVHFVRERERVCAYERTLPYGSTAISNPITVLVILLPD